MKIINFKIGSNPFLCWAWLLFLPFLAFAGFFFWVFMLIAVVTVLLIIPALVIQKIFFLTKKNTPREANSAEMTPEPEVVTHSDMCNFRNIEDAQWRPVD